MKIFDTEADLALAELTEGQYVETYGKLVKGDSLPSRFYIVPVADGYIPIVGDVATANGLTARWLNNINQTGLAAYIEQVVEAVDLDLAGITKIDGTLLTDAISLKSSSELSLPALAALPPYKYDFHINTQAPTLVLTEDNGSGVVSQYTVLVDNNNYSVRHRLGTNASLTPEIAPYAIHYKGDSVTSGPGKKLYTEGERVLTEPDIPLFHVPSGAMLPFGGTSAPTGYLLCDGTAVSRVTYANLFAVIGTSFGSGDGSTTFNLPKSQGQTLRFVDHGEGVDPDAANRTAMNSGGNTGDAVGSVQLDDVNVSLIQSNARAMQPGFPGGSGYGSGGGNENPASLTFSSTRGGLETRSKNFYSNLIIKY